MTWTTHGRKRTVAVKKAATPRATTKKAAKTSTGHTTAHGRSRHGTPLPHGATHDTWGHKGQAKGQP